MKREKSLGDIAQVIETLTKLPKIFQSWTAKSSLEQLVWTVLSERLDSQLHSHFTFPEMSAKKKRWIDLINAKEVEESIILKRVNPYRKALEAMGSLRSIKKTGYAYLSLAICDEIEENLKGAEKKLHDAIRITSDRNLKKTYHMHLERIQRKKK